MFLPRSITRHWPQWSTGLILSLVSVVNGFARGWTSPYVARLLAPDNDLTLTLTKIEASWVVSLLNLGRMFGAIFGAIVQEFIGRKRVLLLSSIPLAVGWICIIAATSVWWLYVFRFLCGVGVGIVTCAMFSFLSEIADPSIRGTLIFLNINLITIGAFMGNVMGPYLSMEHFAYVSLAVIVLFVVFFFYVPESPYFYIVSKNLPEAEKSLKWYKRDADVKKDLQKLQDLVGTTRVSLATIYQELKKPEHQKSMMIIFALNFFLYGAGHGTVSFYAEIILKKSKIDFKPSLVVMALGLSSIITSATAMLLIDKFGRRSLLFSSAAGVAAAHIILGVHFHALSMDVEPSSITWLPIIGLFLDFISVVFGLLPVPGALSGELFPPILKTFASLGYNVSGSLISFGVSKSFQPFLDLAGEKFVFWTFGGVALLAIVFTYFFVPETKGKSLGEIQESLKTSEHSR